MPWFLPLLTLPVLLAPTSQPLAEAVDDEAKRCLALTLYFEARGHGREGMAAVADVVMNRVEHPDFPGTVCMVVKEGGPDYPCQFSWYCDGEPDTPRTDDLWRRAQELAAAALKSELGDPTGGALYYRAADHADPWMSSLPRTARIGGHIFYRPEDEPGRTASTGSD